MRLPAPRNDFGFNPWQLSSLLLCSIAFCSGCIGKPENEVVVYAALDRDFSQPILQSFERANSETTVSAVYDVEASKTVGLVQRLEAEKSRPRCDVFWNNEILHTIRLAQKGLLQPRRWNIPANWPENLKAKDGTWVAVAARARVLLINTEQLPDPAQRPNSVLELADPKWKNLAGVALPLFGTTATHFTVLDSKLGEDNAEKWFHEVAQNATILSGNKQVALAVAAGELQWGLTDTDDAILELDRGAPVAIVFPDQASAQMGTLLLPTSVAVLRDAPHPVAAGKLADLLVSEDNEGRLAISDSAQIPLRPGSKSESRLPIPNTVRWADVDYAAASNRWESMQQKLQTIFTQNQP
jgi:iron(III) transport system substrate-binding protein